jgi:Transglycosylase SLT domain
MVPNTAAPFWIAAKCLLSTKGIAAGMNKCRLFIALSLLILTKPVSVSAQVGPSVEQTPDSNGSICLMIQSVAKANVLPVDFFARLIWVESRFRPDEIGPLTYTGQRAQGIAQFMPDTAAERGLSEPFNPVEALPKSGELLAELRDQFGNLGLAAAAYNAGPERVREFMAGSRDLPLETHNYVLAITGRPVEDWKKPTEAESSKGPKSESDAEADDAKASCREITAFLKQAPDLFSSEAQRWVPNWCRYLHHPNVSQCGSAHEEGSLIGGSNFPNLRSSLRAFWHHGADTPELLRVNILRSNEVAK